MSKKYEKTLQEFIRSKTLIVTVGLPRSGKSTWAKSTGYPIISYDAVRLELVGHYQEHESIKMLDTIIHYAIKALFIAGHDVVIFDSISLLRSQRDNWQSRFNCKFKEFTTDKEECKRRAIESGKEYLVDKIEYYSTIYEPLQDDELRYMD